MHMCNEVGCHTGVFSQQLTFMFELRQRQLEIRRNFTNSVSGAEALNLPTTKRIKL